MSEPKPGRADWPGLAAGAVLAAGTLAVYAGTYAVPWLLDDGTWITNNPSIRRLWPLGPIVAPPGASGVKGRPLLNLSYALNYAVGGTAVSGYHLANLLIHLLAGWILFLLVRRTLLSPSLAERFGSAATPLAFAVSALWTWHPLQTEAVTYLSQRAESLMGLFYLLTLYCFVRGASALGRPASLARATWFSLSVLACLAGVATKEVIVTAPALVLLYDRTFLSGSFAGAWRRHGSLYVGLAATWLPLGFLLNGLPSRGAGFGTGVSAWAYGWAECRVVVKYLLLALWPHSLVFDYGPYVALPISTLWPYAVALALLLALTIVALRRAPAAGFAACWFFLILAPTSSFVPVPGQPMAESRMYLPLAGVAALAVLGFFALVGRGSLPVCAVAALGLGVASAQRNRTYASAQAIWSDAVAKQPGNPRAHENLGDAWSKSPDRANEALAQFEEALRLSPDDALAHYNLGNAWSHLPGRLPEAIAEYGSALRLKPDYAAAHNNLGNAWSRTPGRLNEAIVQYQEALRLEPDFAEAHNNLGNAWLNTPGRLSEAIQQFEAALRLQPDLADAHNNLGNAWLNVPGRLSDAIAQYEEALRWRPDYAEAHNGLGAALAAAGRRLEAIAQIRRALQLRPDYPDAERNLEILLPAPPGKR